MTESKFILRHHNDHNEVHYFVRSGELHESKTLGILRLISTVSENIKVARRFDSAPEAAAVLVEAGNPEFWDILPV
jgi:hypothetical protein